MENLGDEVLLKIQTFIGSVEWRFAKTMAWCPHFYNVLKWNPDKLEGFFLLATAIFEKGEVEKWTDPSGIAQYRKYFHLNGYKYWSMDASVGETDLINRAIEEAT